MNVLKLCEMEFKKIEKKYLFSILGFIILNLFVYGVNLVTKINRMSEFGLDRNISSLREILLQNKEIYSVPSKEDFGSTSVNFYFFEDLLLYMGIVLTFFVTICFIYSVWIWVSDFKDKSIIMLFTLPQKRMNVFYSKFLIIINLIFTFVSLNIVLFYGFLYLTNILLDVNSLSLISNYSLTYSRVLFITSDFLIVNLLRTIILVSSIFTFVIKFNQNKKQAIIYLLSIGLFIYGIFVHLVLYGYSNVSYLFVVILVMFLNFLNLKISSNAFKNLDL